MHTDFLSPSQLSGFSRRRFVQGAMMASAGALLQLATEANLLVAGGGKEPGFAHVDGYLAACRIDCSISGEKNSRN